MSRQPRNASGGMTRTLAVLLMASSVLSAATDFPEEDVAFFRDEVRPILDQHCIRCHGGKDEGGHHKIKSGLQMVSRKGIVLGGDHGSAYNPDEPEKSLLLEVVSYGNEDLQMPPKGKLSEAKRAILTDWVKRGMPWTPEDAEMLVEGHGENTGITQVNETTRNYWSYKPMVRPEVPEVDDTKWGEPIDAFIFRDLAEAGLDPNPPASRGELIRRVYYNLTGLPPTLEEVRAFESDSSDDAWEKVVERLLASPAYGEKWGRHWLDVVRYAETNGFERDEDKPQVWRYRDYVIKAFNEDKPYDQFLREQLAGDELPEPTVDAMVATGYHRLMQWDDEPADRKQSMYDVLDDNLRTTAQGMLAMTMDCARCHDHKGDPIPQEDYYSFLSFFRGVTPMSKGSRATEMVKAGGTGEGSYASRLAAHREREEHLITVLGKAEDTLKKALVNLQPDLAVHLGVGPGAFRTLIVGAGGDQPAQWYYTTRKPEADWKAVGFRAGDAGWKQAPGGFGTEVPGQKARTAWTAKDIWLQTTFGLQEVPALMRMALYHDEDVRMFLNGQEVFERKGSTTRHETIIVDEKFLAALQTGRNTLAVHVRQTEGGQYFDLSLEAGGTKLLTLEEAVKPHMEALLGGKELQAYQDARAELSKHREQVPEEGVEVLTVTEVGTEAPPTYVHIRGNPGAEDTERPVVPRVPSIFGGAELEPTPPSNGRRSTGRRTALADWICRDDNPRTARVMMNRVWQHHFGRGICPSPNDFGYLGEKPTHPELLDWLATEFVAQGWSVKAMHRRILHSRAFQMSSRANPEGLAKDPDNKLFWRFDMRRLTAEEVRDSILAAAGTLNRKQGGPSVFIPLPPEVLATASRKGAAWGKSAPGEELRRTVYVKVKRSLVPPQLSDLDFADTDASCPVRFVTTVPTQALGFLNSDFMNSQAKVFAKRLREEGGPELGDRLRLGLELALSRAATAEEVGSAESFITAMTTTHGLSEDEALDRFALLVLNLNEFIFLD